MKEYKVQCYTIKDIKLKIEREAGILEEKPLIGKEKKKLCIINNNN